MAQQHVYGPRPRPKVVVVGYSKYVAQASAIGKTVYDAYW